MSSLLLAVIYLSFISLGLPDPLLSAAWPEIYPQMGVPLSFAGIISCIISCGTVVSSLLSDRLTHRFGAGKVTAFSVLLTAVALLGFGFSGRFWMLCLWAVPYGLGAGAVDAALNNYVALHYSSRHMNWLHCFWGVGVTISPYVMSFCLARQLGWHAGYDVVSVLQFALTAAIFLSLPLWKSAREAPSAEASDGVESSGEPVSLRKAVGIPGVKLVLGGFLCYCGLEATAILWSCSYLAVARGFDSALAARFGALLFVGIMVGRFLSGFVSVRLGDRNMIRLGVSVAVAGVLLLALPWNAVCLAGLFLLGLGCAPIYPSIIHETPANFGAANSQAIVGIQMASAYVGSTLVPPIFGVVAQHTTMTLLPYYLLLFFVPLFLFMERLNAIVRRRTSAQRRFGASGVSL